MEHFALNDLNIWAILLASLINMAIGSVWYSKILFGNAWMASLGLRQEDLKPSAGLFILTYLLGLVVAFVMALLLQSADSVLTGVIYGAVISMGFVIPSMITHYLFEGRKGTLMLIVSGHEFVVFILYGALLGGWQ